MKNHLGSYECKLCLTLHNNEGSYLAHTQGKKHQQNLWVLYIQCYTFSAYINAWYTRQYMLITLSFLVNTEPVLLLYDVTAAFFNEPNVFKKNMICDS